MCHYINLVILIGLLIVILIGLLIVILIGLLIVPLLKLFIWVVDVIKFILLSCSMFN